LIHLPLLAETFEFVVLTTLMPANTALNWLWHLYPRIPLTRFTVPINASHDFTRRSLHLKFFLPACDWWCNFIDCLFANGQ
jgi:hypothetical protein